jgi:uncharacterized protein (UPF0216 family)
MNNSINNDKIKDFIINLNSSINNFNKIKIEDTQKNSEKNKDEKQTINKDVFLEFLTKGNINEKNKNINIFLDFCFYGKTNDITKEIINTPFFNSTKATSLFIQLFPLNTIPQNLETLETYLNNNSFQFQSIIFDDTEDYYLFHKTLEILLEKNDEPIYSIYRDEKSLIPIILKISHNYTKKINILDNNNEYMQIWNSIFSSEISKVSKKVKKQLIYNNQITI